MSRLITAAKILTLTFALAGVVLPTTASAVQYRAREVVFYDDASYTHQVGYYVSTCFGAIETDGNITDYYVVVSDVVCQKVPK